MEYCKYYKVVGCKECEFITKLNCAKFRKSHCSFLCRNLGKFNFVKQPELKDKVVWSRDLIAIKSLCAQRSIKRNIEVTKYTFNQVLNMELSNEDIPGEVIFVDCSTKILGDIDKISSVLQSFVDRVSSYGFVYIYVKSGIVLNLLEYKKI